VKGFVEPASSRFLSFVCIVVCESEVIIQFVNDSVRLIGWTSRDCVNFVN